MEEVLVVPSAYYDMSYDDLPGYMSRYAAQIDLRDDYATPPVSTVPGRGAMFGTQLPRAVIASHRVGVSYIDRPPRLRTTAVLTQTLEAFQRAVEWADRGGRLVIGVSHGFRDSNVYVGMAPLQFFPAH